jgi:hypothetical protein
MKPTLKVEVEAAKVKVTPLLLPEVEDTTQDHRELALATLPLLRQITDRLHDRRLNQCHLLDR